MLIDTHCHLSFKAFDDTWPEVVKRAREKDIQMIAVGAAKATSEKSIAIAEQSDPANEEAGRGVFAAIGLHPTHTDEVFDYEWFNQAAEHPKVVAMGETGIDHFHIDDAPRHPELVSGSEKQMPKQVRHDGERRAMILKKQEDLLRQHLTIARDKKLPVILHSRDGKTESASPPPGPLLSKGGGVATSSMVPPPVFRRGLGGGLTAYEHLYQVLTDFGYFNGVLHCYGGDWQMAKKFLDLGLMLSFTGIVTFKNASETLKEVVRNTPLDRMMLETDSPYLAPMPYRGKENEPAFVEYVAQGIAQIRGVDYDTVAQATTQNAKRFFGI